MSHENSVVSTVGLRSGPYLPEIEAALDKGTLSEEPDLKGDNTRYQIHIDNKHDEYARVYVAFHSERNNESAWFNNDFSRFWDFSPGETSLLSYQDEIVKANRIRVKYKTRKKAGEGWGSMTSTTSYRPGFGLAGSKFTLSLID